MSRLVVSTIVRTPASTAARTSITASSSSSMRPSPRYSFMWLKKMCSCGRTTPSADPSTGPVTVMTCIAPRFPSNRL